MNKRTLLYQLSFHIIFAYMVSMAAWAGDKWPTVQAQAKAPAWPAPYTGNPSSCQEPHPDIFGIYQSKAGYVDDKEYMVDAYIDLNLDGACEIVAFQMSQCDERGCQYTVFQLQGKKVKNIGRLDFGEYLTPERGWLQLKSKTSTGNNYQYRLHKFVNGAYRVVRIDHFRYSSKSKTTRYIRTDKKSGK